MRHADPRTIFSATLVLALAMTLVEGLHAQTFTVLHNFGAPGDGDIPYAGLIVDSVENLFGTTAYGGNSSCQYGCGVVFELKPNPDGSWSETLIHSFDGTDGARPTATVVFDNRGNLYGTTTSGADPLTYGTVFKLTPIQGEWLWSQIWGFTTLREQDGGVPVAGVTLDNLNRLYVANLSGGTPYLGGVVLSFSQPSALGWHEQILHSFGGGVDGTQPFGTLIFDRNGNLYGTTYSGGSSDDGTVFKLTPNGSGSWTETILYSFTGPPSGGSDGANPEAGLVFDAAGNLYGTTQFGGPTGTGTVFKLTPSVDGTWNESLLYAFNGADGAHPACVPSFDRAGNLYGTTDMGGAYDYGTVFKLTPSFAGQWTETVLHAFSGGADGGYPSAGVILDDSNRLYGTTQEGGPYGMYGGVVFQITP